MRNFISLAGQGHLVFFLKNKHRNAHTHTETHWLAGFPVQMAGDDCVTGANLLHTRLICEQPDAKILVLDSRLSIY